jgi:DNA-binding NarL/FixJ family response regulator
MHMPAPDSEISSDLLSRALMVFGRPSRVLLVENDPIAALELALTVDDLGGEVVGSASSGAVAIAQAGRLRPDIVLMDVELDGDMDGIETAWIIRFRWAVPVVFVTGDDDEETIRRIAAFDGKRVPKPFSSMVLLRMILESLAVPVGTA